MALLTTKEAAELLGVTPRRVTAMIQSEQLPAEKFGRDYLIQERDLKQVADRKVGRPRKSGKKQ
jgi:excisionase family DNA binding protein